MSTTTPNMNLIESTINVDSGLTWETNLNASLTLIDQHNHSPGYGVQINPSGLNINTDLPIGSNNLTLVRSVRFQAQASPLSLSSDIGCLYVSGVDLYYNDISANQIRITSGGLVNATSSGISSGTASASFVSSVLVVNAASNTPANIQAGSILLGNNSAGSNFLTLQPPSAMANNYNLTLPIIPGSNGIVTLNTSGVFGSITQVSTSQIAAGAVTTTQIASATILGSNIAATTITGSNLVNNTVTRTQLAAVGQQVSSSCGSFSTTSSTAVAVTNLSVTLTTSGRPVMVGLQSDGLTNAAIFELQPGGAAGANAFLNYLRGATNIAGYQLDTTLSSGDVTSAIVPPPGFMLDIITAGTYTYTVTLKAFTVSGTATAILNSCVLVAYEL